MEIDVIVFKIGIVSVLSDGIIVNDVEILGIK